MTFRRQQALLDQEHKKSSRKLQVRKLRVESEREKTKAIVGDIKALLLKPFYQLEK